MISVAKEFEISTNPASIDDLCFLGLEALLEEIGVSDGGSVPQSCGSGLSRVSPDLDPEAGILQNGSTDCFGPDDSMAGGGGSAAGGAGNEHLAPASDELKLAHESSEASVAAGKWILGFKTGDMVWGKVESHPWWPGQIFNEALALPSVLSTKTEGYVLVAFFGDGSYGWFDPAVLIPFEPYFPQKSTQANSHSFVTAVEEAVDEVSRRGALAVSCHCRSLCNLRPTSVLGFVAVDVVGYEPGGIYSAEQIEMARDCFRPVVLLSFLHQLAVVPQSGEPRIVYWIKCRSMLLAYRKAVFEEFDKTYTEAFDSLPLRPSEGALGVEDQPGKFTSRGSGKELSAKKWHLPKQKEDATTAGLAKRPLPDVHHTGLPRRQPKSHIRHRVQAPATARQVGTSQRLLTGRSEACKWTSDSWKSRAKPKPTDRVTSAASNLSMKCYRSVAAVGEPDIDPVPKMDLPASVADRTFGGGGSSFSGVPDAMSPSPMNIERMLKKVKVPKRPHQDNVASGGTGQAEKIKKKMKEEPGNEASPDSPPFRDRKISKNGEPFRSSAVKSNCIGPGHAEQQQIELDRKDDSNISCTSAATTVEHDRGLANLVLGLPQLMSDLLALAIDPLHGIDRNVPSIVSQCFLNLRLQTYLKCLVPPPACDANISSKPRICSPKHVGEQRELSSMPSEPIPKHDASEIIGRKRSNCDRLKEWPRKRIKKFEIGSTVAPLEPNYLGPVGNREIQGPKPATSTFLLMRFPPRTALPSVASLNAKFRRFGPLDLCGTRVCWRSHTCNVLFKCKSDAGAAHNYATNHGLFGQIKVNYLLQEAEALICQPLDVGQRPFEAVSEDHLQLEPRIVDGGSISQPRPSLLFQQQRQRSIRPNSDCLFGQIKVDYLLQEAEAPARQPPEVGQRLFEAVSEDPRQRKPRIVDGGLISQPRPSSLFPQQQHRSIRPNSGLKSPVDVMGTFGCSAMKESPPVKLSSRSSDSRADAPAVFTGRASGGLSWLPDTTSKNPELVGFHLPLQPLPCAPPPHPCREMQYLALPPTHRSSPHPGWKTRLPPPPPRPLLPLPSPLRSLLTEAHASYDTVKLNRPDIMYGGKMEGSKVDVSHELLGLLLRCRDIVAAVQSSRGYTPYQLL